MRKEILFAILAGALFGLVIAFGIWKANSSIKPQSVQDVSENNLQTPTTPDSQFGITLVKSEAYEIIASSPTVINGITKPEAWVTVSGEEADYILQADKEGAFSIDVDLISGVNEIIITAFDENGSQISEKLALVLSSEFAKAQENTNNE